MTVDILWQGKPINCMKTFGKNSCTLCMRERCFILDSWNQDKSKLINSKSEIFGGCRHRTKFHRLARNNHIPSTDDGINPEKVSTCASSAAKTIYNKLSRATSRLCHIIDNG